MGDWFRFFLGTPRRFTTTFVVIGLVVVMLRPSILTNAVNALINGLAPLLGPVLAICIVFGGIRWILFGKK